MWKFRKFFRPCSAIYGQNPENRPGIRELKQAGNFLNPFFGIVCTHRPLFFLSLFLFTPERQSPTYPTFKTHTKTHGLHMTMRPVACSPPSSPRPSASSGNTTTRPSYGSQSSSSSSPMSSPIPSTVSAYLGDEDLTSLSDDFASLYAKYPPPASSFPTSTPPHACTLTLPLLQLRAEDCHTAAGQDGLPAHPEALPLCRADAERYPAQRPATRTLDFCARKLAPPIVTFQIMRIRKFMKFLGLERVFLNYSLYGYGITVLRND